MNALLLSCSIHKICVALLSMVVMGGGGCYMQVITYSSFQKKHWIIPCLINDYYQ